MANRQKANNMAARGATAKEIRQATGVTAQAARNIVSRSSSSSGPYNATNMPMTGAAPTAGPLASGYVPLPASPAASPAAPKTSVQQINRDNTMAQNLRAAGGGNGVLSEKELLKISKVSEGKNPEKVLEKAVGKGLMIGSKVVNQYQKGKYTDAGTAWARAAIPNFAVAVGKDSQILQQLRNAGRQDKGSALFIGSKGSTATTLPRNMGFGNNQQPTPTTTPIPTEAAPTDTGTAPTEMFPPFIPEELPEEQLPPGPGMMAGGGLGALGANKLNRAKSRLRQLGIYGRGTGLLGRGLQYGNALNK